MNELVILGSGCAFATNTRHNPSVAVLDGSQTHIFDCGEPVAALLYRSGISVTSLKSIFISHLHMDHLGGLPQLIHAIRLMSRTVDPSRGLSWAMHARSDWHLRHLRYPLRTDGVTIDTTLPSVIHLHVPKSGITPVREFFAACSLGPEQLGFDLDWQGIEPGQVYAQDQLRVSANRSTHLARIPQDSFSFLIELGGRRIVYSGDLGRLDDLLPIMDQVDVLLLELSHLKPGDVRPFIRQTRPHLTVLTHVHGGLEDQATALARELADLNVHVARDGLRFPLETSGRVARASAPGT